jgi:aerobic carbon-monoxide dehydrogenase medium subunit
VKPAPFTYVAAESVEYALETLREHGDEAKVLAGGQSLVPALNMRLVRPAVLVDLNRIEGLDEITEANGALHIGALVRQAAAERSTLVLDSCPLLAHALPHVGHFVTRNRGTVGGSVAHGDAAAELPLALVALGGTVVTSRRTIPAEEFFVTHFTTALEPDELLTATTWPRLQPGQGWALEEFALRHGDFALASAACSLWVRDGRVEGLRLAVGSVTDRPELLDAQTLVGGVIDSEAASQAGSAAAEAVDPPPNLHGSPDYRRRLIALLVERAVNRAWERGTS